MSQKQIEYQKRYVSLPGKSWAKLAAISKKQGAPVVFLIRQAIDSFLSTVAGK